MFEILCFQTKPPDGYKVNVRRTTGAWHIVANAQRLHIIKPRIDGALRRNITAKRGCYNLKSRETTNSPIGVWVGSDFASVLHALQRKRNRRKERDVRGGRILTATSSEPPSVAVHPCSVAGWTRLAAPGSHSLQSELRCSASLSCWPGWEGASLGCSAPMRPLVTVAMNALVCKKIILTLMLFKTYEPRKIFWEMS